MKRNQSSAKLPKQAILLAAGLGTRLRPVTENIPKPALPLGGMPILFFNLCLLEQAGVSEVTINLFHRPEALRRLFKISRWGSVKIHWSLEKKILGTAGGIAKALRQMKNRSTYVLNGDILTDLNLTSLHQIHRAKQSMATLAVVDPETIPVNNFVFFSKNHRISRIGAPNGTTTNQRGIFTGVHLIEPELFSKVPKNTFSCVIHDVYQKALARNERLCAFVHRGAWWDLGQLAALKEMDQNLWEGEVPAKIGRLYGEVKNRFHSTTLSGVRSAFSE